MCERNDTYTLYNGTTLCHSHSTSTPLCQCHHCRRFRHCHSLKHFPRARGVANMFLLLHLKRINFPFDTNVCIWWAVVRALSQCLLFEAVDGRLARHMIIPNAIHVAHIVRMEWSVALLLAHLRRRMTNSDCAGWQWYHSSSSGGGGDGDHRKCKI